MIREARLGRVLGLVPAKAGSMRLPGKNIRTLAGVSLLERAIRSTRKSCLCDRISVSTEDAEIARIAQSCGIEMPFMRPSHLAKDPAGVVEVCLHALDEWEARGEHFDTLIIVLPTSPFRQASDLVEAMETYIQLKVDFLMSVAREVHLPLSSLVKEAGLLVPLHPEWLNRTGARATAELPNLVRCNGAVTIVNVERFRAEKNYYAYPLGAYEMPIERSLDIDTELEFSFAEFLAERHPEWLDD
jgi:CMP-N,N'-diacetyllegionaminic acid synthase